MERNDITAAVIEIVKTHVANHNATAEEVGGLIDTLFDKLTRVATGEITPADDEAPIKLTTRTINASYTDDHINCFECGKPCRSLAMHLRPAHGMTVDAYFAKWNLPAGYPRIAKSYSAERSREAKGRGLGRKSGRGR